MMVRLSGFFIILLFLPLFSLGQESSGYTEPGGANVLYRKEKQGGIMIHSHGFGGYYRNGTHRTGSLRRFWEVELVTLKHPKELRTVTLDNSTRGFVYGKMNSVMVSRVGFGYQRKLHGKDDGRGIEVRGHFFAGPSIAWAKPVYLKVINPVFERTSIEKYDPEEHQLNEIFGKGPLFRGIEETRPYPGFYIKSGLAFEYSGNFDRVKGLECGVIVDGYLKPVPIMAFADNPRVWVSLYLSFFFGKKFV